MYKIIKLYYEILIVEIQVNRIVLNMSWDTVGYNQSKMRLKNIGLLSIMGVCGLEKLLPGCMRKVPKVHRGYTDENS